MKAIEIHNIILIITHADHYRYFFVNWCHVQKPSRSFSFFKYHLSDEETKDLTPIRNMFWKASIN